MWSLTSLRERLVKTGAPRAARPLRRLPTRRGGAAAGGVHRRAQPDRRPAWAVSSDGRHMTGAPARSPGRSAGEGGGAPHIRAFPCQRYLTAPFGRRFRARHGAGDAGRAIFRLIGFVAARKLLVREANEESRLRSSWMVPGTEFTPWRGVDTGLTRGRATLRRTRGRGDRARCDDTGFQS